MINRTRYFDWITRLNDFIDQSRTRQFEWGAHDCALFACSAVQAMTGEDPGTTFRGQYNSAVGAARALLAQGYPSLSAAADALCGEPITAPFTAPGDVVLLPTPDGDALGVCCGTHCAVVGPTGLVFLNRTQIVRAWRI